MNLQENKIYSNFLLKKVEEVNEVNSITYEFEHIKSGAKLLFVSNDDDNKVFSITFRTPPVDDTGSAHILEHSVLCGSDKYPLKEPFVELLKSSMNTFLNAMTFSDKTMYPVASLNEADFRNLMDVYLDAVFNPAIYSKKEILEQEGWHYHIENKEDDIKYNGVVYNEMKGAFSDPEGILARLIESSLYPDTPYFYESGGDPKSIPTLEYETFLDFHRRYYHPCNSYIYIYGDTDILRHLEYLDKEYLNKYEKIDIDSTINEQKDFSNVKKYVEEGYSVSTDENIDDKYMLTLNWSIGNVHDVKLGIIFNILQKVLFDSDSSYLKKALVDAKIADSVSFDYNGGILQPFLTIFAKNANKKNIKPFQELVDKTLREIVDNGIDKKIIIAAINNFEFNLKEADSGNFPKGLIYNIAVMEGWLYDEAPMNQLKYENALKEIREKIDDGIFEKAIKEHIIDNEKKNYVVLKPVLNLSEKEDKELADKLKKYKDSLNESEIENLIAQTNSLLKMQQTPDSKEAKDTIPRIELSDINSIPSAYDDVETIKVRDNNLYIRKDSTKGISYIDVQYEVGIKSAEELHLISLLVKCYESFDTKNYDVLGINNLINENLGDIDFSISPYHNSKDPEKFRFFFTCVMKAFSSNEEKMYAIMEELMSNTIFDDKEKLKKLVKEEITKLEASITNAAHRLVTQEIQARTHVKSDIMTHLSGIPFYEFMKDLKDNFDEKADSVINGLKELTDRILKSRKDLIITVSEEDYDLAIENGKKFFEKHEEEDYIGVTLDRKQERDNIGIAFPSLVNYTGEGFMYKDYGFKFDGSVIVLKKYLSTEYLWNNVRVMGGAYGSFMNVDIFGDLNLVSYRDPNIKKTYDTYAGLYEYIKNIDLSDEDLTRIIIGTMSDVDVPVPVYNKIRKYVNRIYTESSYEEIKETREQILSTTVEDLRKHAEMFKSMLEHSYKCTAGSKTELTKNKEYFDRIIDLF